MIPSLSLLSLTGMALWATPITIGDVTSAREGSRLVVDITADATVDPEAASAKIADGRIYLFVTDTRVKADNRAWGEGEAEIRAHRHKHQVELVVPQGEDACQGPVEFVKVTGGLRAVVGCDVALGGGKHAVETVRAARPKTQTAPAGFSAPILTTSTGAPIEPPPAARKADAAREARELKAMLDLDVRSAKDDEAAAPAAKEAVTASAAKPMVAAPALVALPVRDQPAQPTATPVLAIGAGPATAAEAGIAALAPGASAKADPSVAHEPAAQGGSGGGAGIYFAGVLLLALAGGAYFFARKRAAVPRFVRILETASLGPKRAIVVAEIGGETLILGTSEAGITVLQTTREPTAAASPMTIAAPAPSGRSIIPETAVAGEFDFPEGSLTGEIADIPEADFSDEASMPAQGGLLARLFRRAKPANESEFHNFEELLEDSVEDQELRQKLSLGLAARVR
ncbi:MAG TPA: flagellar biosynthetic protein FliO [Polyangia bacterium]|jgi:hypothetical protein|nr:flagellar biosynthetic protein FliO [Polyangia bacterium]